MQLLKYIQNDNIVTHNIKITEMSIYHALICNFIRIQMKYRMNHSDIPLDISIIKSSPNYVISTAREQLTVPELLCGRNYDYEVTLRSCTILTVSIKCAVPSPTCKKLLIYQSDGVKFPDFSLTFPGSINIH